VDVVATSSYGVDVVVVDFVVDTDTAHVGIAVAVAATDEHVNVWRRDSALTAAFLRRTAPHLQSMATVKGRADVGVVAQGLTTGLAGEELGLPVVYMASAEEAAGSPHR
jgi:hypothetical protein